MNGSRVPVEMGGYTGEQSLAMPRGGGCFQANQRRTSQYIVLRMTGPSHSEGVK